MGYLMIDTGELRKLFFQRFMKSEAIQFILFFQYSGIVSFKVLHLIKVRKL